MSTAQNLSLISKAEIKMSSKLLKIHVSTLLCFPYTYQLTKARHPLPGTLCQGPLPILQTLMNIHSRNHKSLPWQSDSHEEVNSRTGTMIFPKTSLFTLVCL